MYRKLDQGDDLNCYFIKFKREYQSSSLLSQTNITECFNFSWDMTFGTKGEHRSYRSGGVHSRKNGEIFINTFQGKLSEFTVYNFLQENGITSPKPDLSTYALGEWDSFDIEANSKKINIKSTKFYGNLLLLETKDWSFEGQYLPNKEKPCRGYYDIFLLVRISPDGEALMRRNRMFFSNNVAREELESIVLKEDWNSDIPGFATLDDIKFVISNKHILPQGSKLNGKTPMDAENYYIQSGDMHNIEELIHLLTPSQHE